MDPETANFSTLWLGLSDPAAVLPQPWEQPLLVADRQPYQMRWLQRKQQNKPSPESKCSVRVFSVR